MRCGVVFKQNYLCSTKKCKLLVLFKFFFLNSRGGGFLSSRLQVKKCSLGQLEGITRSYSVSVINLGQHHPLYEYKTM